MVRGIRSDYDAGYCEGTTFFISTWISVLAGLSRAQFHVQASHDREAVFVMRRQSAILRENKFQEIRLKEASCLFTVFVADTLDWCNIYNLVFLHIPLKVFFISRAFGNSKVIAFLFGSGAENAVWKK